jgi:hypothetical protein
MKRTVLIVIGIVVLVALLASAAYVGARMLAAPGAAAGSGSRAKVIEFVGDDGSGPVSLHIRIEPAPELPDRAPDAAGIYVRRQDSSLYVGTGGIELDVEVNGNTGERQVNLSHDGPEVEVVYTRDTVLYRDETEMPIAEPGKMKSGEHTIQQTIVPAGSLEEIGQNTELQVWGRKRGDRIVAEVIVYRVVEGF